MEIETLLSLSRSQQSFYKSTSIKNIQIHQHQHFKWLYHHHPSNSAIISIINLEYPNVPIADYQHAMLASTFLTTPSKICNLGMATGAFERYLHHLPLASMPQIDSVEINTDLIELAKTEFQLPHHLNLYTQPADIFMAQNTQQYDVILCDVFDGERIPDSLLQPSFFTHLYNALEPTGVIALNLLPNDEQDMLEILIPLREVFPHQWLIDIPNYKNVVLIISRTPIEQHQLTAGFQAAESQHLQTKHFFQHALQLPQPTKTAQ